MTAGSIFDAVDANLLERFGVTALAVGMGPDLNLVCGYGVPGGTTFRIASITKPLVAATAMRLVEEGQLTLDEPLTTLRLPWEGITLRHLLSHQAGLARDWPRPLSGYGEGSDQLEQVGRGRGRRRSCRPGPVLLLMERTGFSPIEPAVLNDMPYPRARRPSGGLYSCAEDLLAFAGHLLVDPGPLSSEPLREMRTPQIEIAPDGDYGLGLGVIRGRGKLTFEHGGVVPGVRTLLLVVPEGRTALVLLTNSDRGHFLINRLLRSVDLAVSIPADLPASDDDLAAVSGTFREPLGTQIRVTPRDGGIDLALVGGKVTAHLRAVSPTRFVVREGEEKGDWAEFFEEGQLMRYDTLYERAA